VWCKELDRVGDIETVDLDLEFEPVAHINNSASGPAVLSAYLDDGTRLMDLEEEVNKKRFLV